MGYLLPCQEVMAVTSIRAVTSRVDRVLKYAANPEKTTEKASEEIALLHRIDNEVQYAANELKTEHRAYVTGINCTEENAAKCFMRTKAAKDNSGGRLCYHAYQSFAKGEVNAETAHRIGVELAKEMWGDRFEVLVATHLNTEHYHSHFIINSVSFVDGKKFYNSPADLKRMREISDRLCRENKLSVITKPQNKGKNYGEWLAEKQGKPTRRNMIQADVERAVASAMTEQQFIDALTAMGYELKIRGEHGQYLKHPAIRPLGAKNFYRFYRLGENCEYEQLIDRVYRNHRRRNPFPEADDETIRTEIQKSKPRPKATGLYALYLYYCYELHIIQKHPTYQKRVPFALKEDLIQLEKLDAQTLLLGKYGISNGKELVTHRKDAERKIEILVAKRKDLRNELKRLNRDADHDGAGACKQKIAEISAELKELRKEVSLCSDIEQRSTEIAANLKKLEEEQNQKEQEENNNELFRRDGRSGR